MRRRVFVLPGNEDSLWNATTYELKYCERCGALGTRRSAATNNYCESCAQVMARSSFPGVPDWQAASAPPRQAGPGCRMDVKAEAHPACGGLQ